MKTIQQIAQSLNATRFQINSLVRQLKLNPADRVGPVRLFDARQIALISQRFEDTRTFIEAGCLINRLASPADMAKLLGVEQFRVDYHLRRFLDQYRRLRERHLADPEHVAKPHPIATVFRLPFGRDELFSVGVMAEVRDRIAAAGADAAVVERERVAVKLQETSVYFLSHEELIAPNPAADLPEVYAARRTELRDTARKAVARASADKDD